MSKEAQNFRVRLFESTPKIFDKSGKQLTIHFRMNNKTNELEVLVNRACKKCTSFKKIKGNTEICIKCKYIKDWLEVGKR